MANWIVLSPFEKVIKPITGVADTLSTALSPVKVVLNIALKIIDTAKVFLLDLGNPVKLIIKVVVKAIDDLLNNINQGLGIYFLPIVPYVQDQTPQDMTGGLDHFIDKMSNSLNDTSDANRPRFTSTSLVGCFIIYLDSGNIGEIYNKFMTLFNALGMAISQGDPAPINVKARPITSDGVVIVNNLDLFSFGSFTYGGIQISWNIDPRSATLAEVAIPQSWLVERSKSPNGTPMLIDEISYNSNGDQVTVQKQVQDLYGRPVSTWELVKLIDPSEVSYWAGGLFGSWIVIDANAQEGETWYYRVRSQSGDPQWKIINGIYYVYDGVYGTPSEPYRGTMPKASDFKDRDLKTALLNTAYAALLLGFNYPYAKDFPGQGVLVQFADWSYYISTSMNDFWVKRIEIASDLSSVLGVNILTSSDMTNFFWTTYQANQASVDGVANYDLGKLVSTDVGGNQVDGTLPYINQNIGSISLDKARQDVYNTLRTILGALETPGKPPNWMNIRINQFIPAAVFETLREAEAAALGVAANFDGLVDDIVAFLNVLEAYILIINDLVKLIEDIIDILRLFNLPTMDMLLIKDVSGGLGGLMGAINSAGNKPTTLATNYGCGVVCLWGGPDFPAEGMAIANTIFSLVAGI